ncbi:Single-stranded DNA-binding protein A [bioreactor metagenome]|uniref:Single-stranded DNA-binding protein A n=1 Tax=bioreactor metagenome TaxID=1076179 RepID=A0A645D3V2_9ZZZZ|nr:single-stranded DNA-binding protein [Erysipelotrichaceae bacterium]
MINRVVLVGRLVRDPELKKTTSGNAVCTFTVAVDNRMKAPDGSKTTSFLPCVTWNQTADTVSKFARKGMLVGVEGRLNQRSFERKDGTKGSITEIVCDSVQFLEPKGASGSVETTADDSNMNQTAPETGKNLDSIDIPDDDLPF